MSSRVFLLLGLLAAFVLLFASEVAARDLAETTSATDEKDGELHFRPLLSIGTEPPNNGLAF